MSAAMCVRGGFIARRTVSALVVAVSFAPVLGATILDDDYFASLPHTLITFETDAAGNPVDVSQLPYYQIMPWDEYAAFGFTFSAGASPGVAWVYSSSLGGPPGEVALSATGTDNLGDFLIEFSVPVRSFGFWVYHNTTRPGVPMFEAFNGSDPLDTAYFEGSAIDGTAGQIDYGFLGVAAGQDITVVHVGGDVAGLDNFMFSAVPEPATLSLIALGAWFAAGRRR